MEAGEAVFEGNSHSSMWAIEDTRVIICIHVETMARQDMARRYSWMFTDRNSQSWVRVGFFQFKSSRKSAFLISSQVTSQMHH